MTRIIAGVAGVERREQRLAHPVARRARARSRRRAQRSTARDAVRGSRVLDLYAGSGALGLEAASRGAASVVLVESDRRAADVIARNIRDLGLAGVQVLRSAVGALLAAEPGPSDAADLVLVDPPYDVDEDALAVVLRRLGAGWLAPGGLVVVERSTRSPEPTWPDGIRREVEPRKYGETTIWYATRD